MRRGRGEVQTSEGRDGRQEGAEDDGHDANVCDRSFRWRKKEKERRVKVR